VTSKGNDESEETETIYSLDAY
jgi:hypothetical protein